MKVINIKIEEKNYIIKQSFRTYMLFEKLTGKQISDIVSMEDNLMLIYCTFKANNADIDWSFDEFIDKVDEYPYIITEFAKLKEDTITEVTEKKRNRKV